MPGPDIVLESQNICKRRNGRGSVQGAHKLAKCHLIGIVPTGLESTIASSPLVLP
jgi:hypothetical protein